MTGKIPQNKTITPQKPITYGGVKLNENEVQSKKVVKENGATRFVISFKNGSTVKYPQQAKHNNAEITSSNYTETKSGRELIANTEISRLFGAEFTGTQYSPHRDGNYPLDSVSLNGCTNCKVDVSNDVNKNEIGDRVFVFDDHEYGFKAKNNVIKQDKYDETDIITSNKDLTIVGEGTHIEK